MPERFPVCQSRPLRVAHERGYDGAVSHGGKGSLGVAAAVVALVLHASFHARAATPDGREAIAALAADLDAALRAAPKGTVPLSSIGDRLGRFLAEGSLPERFATPHPGLDVTTYLLHAAPDGSFSIAALVLRPGKGAPLHDHRTWTVWGTLRGRDRERQFERRGEGEAFPELVPIVDHAVAAGAVSIVEAPPRDVHVVENAGDTPSVSIHVHGADLSQITRNRYDLERRSVLPFVQTYVSGGGEP